MRICNLASGSKGNMTYIEVGNTKCLVDVGLTCKGAEERLKLLGVAPQQLDAILITHEHSDHIKGLELLATKYGIPVFAHSKTWNALQRKVPKLSIQLQRDFFDDPFTEKDLAVFPFAVSHDTEHCVGFSFLDGSKKASIVTDLGKTDENIFKSVAGSTFVLLESNYDVAMLNSNPRYPAALKRRINGPKGHLSNDAAGVAAVRLVRDSTKQIVLGHLSEENNTPQAAFETVTSVLTEAGISATDVRVSLAYQHKPTSVYVLK